MEKNVTKVFGIKILKSGHKDIRRLKRNEEEPSIHGHKMWGSSFMLMDFFKHNPPPKKSRVLELGAGWGQTSIYLAKKHKAKVTATDADPAVFKYLDLFAEHNDVSVKTKVAKFEKLTKKELSKYDIIVGGDICFWDELGDILYKLIKRAIDAGVKQIVIADPQRSPFNDLAERCVKDFHAELLDWDVDKPKRFTGSILLIENA